MPRCMPRNAAAQSEGRGAWNRARLGHHRDDMKLSIIVITTALSLAGGCKSLTPEIPVYPITDFFDNGELKTIYFAYTNSAAIEIKHGVYTSYWGGGRKKKEAHYNQGILEGREAYWDENGLMTAVCSYSKGKKDGEQQLWFRNGQQKEFRQYKDGKEEGVCKSWYSNGSRMAETEYRKGLRHGTAKEWSDLSKPLSISTYVSGKLEGVKTGFYHSGEKQYESLFHKGQRQGRKVSWDRTGEIIADGLYLNDLPWSGTFIIQWNTEDNWTKAEFKDGMQN